LIIMLFFILFYGIIYIAKSTGVCDEKTLILELKQDIEDNGVLDCLRTIQAPNFYMEDWKEKNKRLAA